MLRHLKTFIKQFFLILLYISRIRDIRRPKLEYNKYKAQGKKAVVCGNGPSIKTLFEKYDKGEIQISSDSFFVNFAPIDDHFFKIKPKHYFISDYGFSRENPRTPLILELYERLQNNVDWNLNIYIARKNKKECQQLVDYSKITNPNIHFIFIYKRHCEDLLPSLRNFLYKSGYFMPIESTIINTALWTAILLGYDYIDLYGVETNQFKDLYVDDDNTLYITDKHFYETILVPVLHDDTGENSKIHVFLGTICGMLRSHYYLSLFADYMRVKIYNCTPESMIDSYERKNTLKN